MNGNPFNAIFYLTVIDRPGCVALDDDGLRCTGGDIKPCILDDAIGAVVGQITLCPRHASLLRRGYWFQPTDHEGKMLNECSEGRPLC